MILEIIFNNYVLKFNFKYRNEHLNSHSEINLIPAINKVYIWLRGENLN